MRPQIKICALSKGNALEPSHNISLSILIFIPNNCHSAWDIVGAQYMNVVLRKHFVHIERFFISENVECA